MSDDVTNWTDLREFTAVDLTQSFVVAWRTGDGQYEIMGDFGTLDIAAERPLLRLKGPFA